MAFQHVTNVLRRIGLAVLAASSAGLMSAAAASRAQAQDPAFIEISAPGNVGAFGSRLAGLGDANEDGTTDLAVTALGTPPTVYLFQRYGPEDPHVIPIRNPTAFLCPRTSQFGQSLAAVGDLDGDGATDLAVTAHFNAVERDDGTVRCEQGRVFVFSGANGDLIFALDDPDPEPRWFGRSVAAVGDLDGDDVPDIAVGVAHLLGHVHLFSGANGSPLSIRIVNPEPDEVTLFGFSVAAAGDQDSDSVPDVFVAAKRPGRRPKVFLFSGADGSHLRTLQTCVDGPSLDADTVLAPLGDLDGDGLDDVALGLSTASQVHVFSGGGTGGECNGFLRTLDNPNPQEGGGFGRSLAGLPDVDGDGVADLAVGAHENDAVPEEPLREGQVFFFSGASLDPLPELTLTGEQASFLGISLASLTDISDGGPGLAVGASRWEANAGPGRVEVYRLIRDADGDGIPDDRDACPDEDSTGFDLDQDGCIDIPSGLAQVVDALVEADLIDQSLRNSLLAKTVQAEGSADRESLCAAVHMLEALIHEVEAHAGAKISVEAAEEVVGFAGSVISYLESLLPSGENC